MCAQRILLIDDELEPGATEPGGSYMWFYSQALRDAGFEVVEIASTDEAVRVLADESAAFNLILLDIMMSPGEALAQEDTTEGLRTGVFLADMIRQVRPETPVVVLTNWENPERHAELKQRPNVRRVVVKASCAPFELIEVIRPVVGE